MKQIADYRFVEKLGDGNHGQFFKTRPPARLGVDDEFVAVKVLNRHATDDEFRRFANELKLFASVPSPHLVTVIDAGQQSGTLYYATAYYPSGSLMTPKREIDIRTKLQAVADAARGAHALHEVGVAHRDIKPANILLANGGAQLSDLGLAQVLEPGQTVTGTGPIGSIEFMEPRRVRGEKASRASDIWELGVTLHWVLTGKSVFGEIPSTDVLSALRHVLATEPAVDESLPQEQSEVVARCLEQAPEDRPVTAEELAIMIERIIR